MLSLARFIVLTSVAFIAVFTAGGNQAHAKSASKTAAFASSDASCATDKNDRYENALRFGPESGKYHGLCINTELFRKPSVISENKRRVTVTNIRHDKRFWLASFPTADDEIVDYEFLVRRDGFIVKSGHTQMLISFKNPVKLRAQDGSGDTELVRNFVYSVEATFPKHKKFSVIDGLGANFLLIGRLLTAKQSIEEEEESHYDRYPIRLGYQERAQVLKLVLEQAEGLGHKTSYNTFKRNCTSALVNIFDRLPRFKDYQLGFKASISLDPIVGHGVKSLGKRGLLEKRMKSCVDAVGNRIKDCRFSIAREEILD